jgi:hypothetical protein
MPQFEGIAIYGNSSVAIDAAQGATAPANSISIGGTYNSSLPSLSNTQQSAIQLDTKGQVLIDLNYVAGTALGSPSNYGTSPGAVEVIGVNSYLTNVGQSSQTTATWTNSTSSTAAASISVVGYSTLVLTLSSVFNSGTMQLFFQVSDTAGGTNWYGIYGATTVLGVNSSLIISGTSTYAVSFDVAGWNQFRVYLNTNTSTATSTLNIGMTASAASTVPLVLIGNGITISAGTVAISGTVAVTQSGTWTAVGTNADASIGAGTAPSKALAVAGVYNSSLPSPSNGQTVAIQLDSAGQLLVDLNYVAGTALGALANYGTSPGAVKVPSVNAYITNTPAVTLTSTTITGTVAVTESGTWNVGSSTATGSAVPANAFFAGLQAQTSYPTAASSGNLVGAMADKAGRQAVVLNTVRDLVGTAALSSSSSSATSFISAGGSGVFNDICELVITNESSTATVVSLSDNGSGGTVYKFAIAANGGMTKTFATPLPQGTSNAAWDVLNSAAVALDYVAVFAKNK